MGFLLGAELVAAVFGDRLFATLLGWMVGIGLGVMLAVVAGLAFRIAVVILALSVGYWVGSGLLVALGLEPGLLTSAGGAVVAAALAILAIYADGPRLLVAALTAWGGAAIGLAGALVLVGGWSRPGCAASGPSAPCAATRSRWSPGSSAARSPSCSSGPRRPGSPTSSSTGHAA